LADIKEQITESWIGKRVSQVDPREGREKFHGSGDRGLDRNAHVISAARSPRYAAFEALRTP
jgi:hypothetical protein